MHKPKVTRALFDGLSGGDTDPIESYAAKPLIGGLLRARLNLGLAMLPPLMFERGLELGYGSGAVQLALTKRVKELHGIDADADPEAVAARLAARGTMSTLVRGSPYALPYPDEHFELVVAFSVLEHLRDPGRALREITRVMRPSSYFVLGMPAVSPAIDAALQAIGARRASRHPVTTPGEVASLFHDAGLRVLGTNDLALRPPLSTKTYGPTLYFNWLLTRLRTDV
ncbi:class I SAM-dependent methyltransferase [Myxococcota bacterium]|nr:class I SAM-dependent methyltransferase [Myxococcota bacterium]